MSNPLQNSLVRKTAFIVEDTLLESSASLAVPVRKVAGLAVLRNPCADAEVEDLKALADIAVELGEHLMPKMMSLLGTEAVSYGKAAIVGVNGLIEHAAALLHPTLGRPIREAVGGGESLIPSNAKIGALGTTIDVPLGHRNNAWSFDEIDTITLSLADAPKPDEILLIIAIASSGRPNARVSSPARAQRRHG